MKRLIVLLTAVLSACSLRPVITFTEGKVSYDSEKGGVNIVYPIAKSQNKSVADSINNAVQGWLQSEDTPSLEAIVEQAKQYEADSIGYANDMVWSGFKNEDIVSLYLERYVFTGGAHGATSIRTLVFDTKNGRKINLKDYIADTALFRKFITGEYIIQNKLNVNTPAGDIGYFTELKDLPIPETLILTDKGLTGYYQQYEVACYAVGITSVTISYRDLNGMLNLEISDPIKPIEISK